MTKTIDVTVTEVIGTEYIHVFRKKNGQIVGVACSPEEYAALGVKGAVGPAVQDTDDVWLFSFGRAVFSLGKPKKKDALAHANGDVDVFTGDNPGFDIGYVKLKKDEYDPVIDGNVLTAKKDLPENIL